MTRREKSGAGSAAKRSAGGAARPAAKKVAKQVAKKAAKRPAPKKAVPKRAAGAGGRAGAAPRAAFRRRRQPESLRLRAMTPSMTVDDLETSIEFYTRALGFVVTERWTGAGGELLGVMLAAGSCSIGLAQDDWKKGRRRKKGVGFRLWCETAQDLDALARRIRAGGGPEEVEPKTEEWGSRSLSVVDPDGYRMSFTEAGKGDR